MEYTVIDFETANSNRSSACSLGVIEVKDGRIINEKSYLIDPEEEFDAFNIFIHGITEKMVKGKPTLKELYPELKQLLEGKFIVAHNASFDISVLRHGLDKYSLEYPNFNYSCTRILSKKTWNNLINYKLDTIADYLNIEFKHHDATEDARTTALIFEEILKLNETDALEELHKMLKVRIGQVYKGGYKATELKGDNWHIDVKSIVPQTNEFDTSNEFYNKCVVFTGTLQSMVRKEAMQKVVNVGGKCSDRITKDTNYLIMGVQDYSKFADGQKSSKLKKAEQLVSKGQELEIITEDDFLRYL